MRKALHWQILIAMLLGAALGIVLNRIAGRQSAGQETAVGAGNIQLIGMSKAVEVPAGKVWTRDTPERIFIQLGPQCCRTSSKRTSDQDSPTPARHDKQS